MKFYELDINDDLLDGLDAMNFVECTPVQEQAIPIALEGYDLLASAQTGTGKTAAYLLPVLEMLSRYTHDESKVNALILVPTRELALQVNQLIEGFAFYQDTSWIAVYGGNDGIAFSQQQRALQQGCDIVVATPGRLLSILRMQSVDLSAVDYLVLDEADRMLDIGFYDDIMEIISHLPNSRQTLMFSATFPKDVEKLARQVLYEPKEVKIAVSKPAENIVQSVALIPETQKIEYVKHLFKSRQRGKSIIFVSSKDKTKEVYRALIRQHLDAAQMHSDLTQDERTKVMLDFRNNKINILVATDVVSRGIDIEDIELVVNYDVPAQPEDYVHRVGRTARAGAAGEAITLVSPNDHLRLRRLEKFLDKTIMRAELPEGIEGTGEPQLNDNRQKPSHHNSQNHRNSKGRNNHKNGSQNHHRERSEHKNENSNHQNDPFGNTMRRHSHHHRPHKNNKPNGDNTAKE
ncbi:MAG: DEAD/DEAH box helicase [Paludibacteraceae bacterium]|nr:DEAD/DEAH box helicase [Paludibacteraceae bacterium]